MSEGEGASGRAAKLGKVKFCTATESEPPSSTKSGLLSLEIECIPKRGVQSSGESPLTTYVCPIESLSRNRLRAPHFIGLGYPVPLNKSTVY